MGPPTPSENHYINSLNRNESYKWSMWVWDHFREIAKCDQIPTFINIFIFFRIRKKFLYLGKVILFTLKTK